MGRLENKVCIINGAGPGYGRTVALAFAKEGAKVICCGASEKNSRETAELIKEAGGDAIYAVADASDLSQVQAAVAKGLEAYGRIDVLYNNAGLQGVQYYANILDTDPQNFYRSVAVNYQGHWNYMRTVSPIMHDQGGGSIVNMASAAGVKGGNTIYGSTKTAVIGVTRATETDLGQYNIRLNSVSPFYTRTPIKLNHEAEDAQERENVKNFAKDSPMKKVAEIPSVVDAVVFLASDESAGVAAFNLRVDTAICVKALPVASEADFLAANPYD